MPRVHVGYLTSLLPQPLRPWCIPQLSPQELALDTNLEAFGTALAHGMSTGPLVISQLPASTVQPCTHPGESTCTLKHSPTAVLLGPQGCCKLLRGVRGDVFWI